MNQIIVDNRHKINTACQICFFALDKYHKAVNAFNEEKRRIAATPYIQQEQERMVNQASDALKNSAQGYYEEIKRNLDTIRAAAGEMENMMDIGEDLQNALSVIKALGGSLPGETRIKLVEQFKGQRQALSLLKAAYESAGITSQPYFQDLILNTAKELDALDDKAYRMVVAPGENMMIAVNFGRDLEKFAESLGVDLTKKFGEIVDTSDALNAQLRAAMGLGAST